MKKYKVTVPVEVIFELDVDDKTWYVPVNRAKAQGQEIVSSRLNGLVATVGDIQAQEIKIPDPEPLPELPVGISIPEEDKEPIFNN